METDSSEEIEIVNKLQVHKVPIYKNLNTLIKRVRVPKPVQENEAKVVAKEIITLVPIEDIPKLQEPTEKVTIIERAIGFVIEDKEALKNHLNVSTAKGPPFNCTACNNCFISGSKLAVHYSLNHNISHCDVCGCLFETIEEKEKHILQFHSSLFCEICQEHFTSYPTLLKHYDDAHETTSCIFCGLLQKKSDTIPHVLKKHCVSPTFLENFNESKCVQVQGNKFYCAMCEKRRAFDSLYGHMHSHHKINVTSMINLMLKQKSKLLIKGAPTKNLTLVSETPDEQSLKNCCPVCARNYTTKITAAFHQVYCEGKLKCMYCNKMFTSQEKREKHMNTHVFSCELDCTRLVFSSLEELHNHYKNIHQQICCKFCDSFLEAVEGNYNEHLIEKHKYKNEEREISVLFYLVKYNEKEVIKCSLCDENVTLLCGIIKDLFLHFTVIHNFSIKKLEQFITPKPIIGSENKIKSSCAETVAANILKRNKTVDDSEDESEKFDIIMNNNNTYVENIAVDFDFQQLEGILNSESESEDELEYLENLCDLCGREETSIINLVKHMKEIHCIESATENIQCEFCEAVFRNSYSHGKHLLQHKNDDDGDKEIELFSCGCDNVVIYNARKHLLKNHSDSLKDFDVVEVGVKCRFCKNRFWTKAELNEHEVSTHFDDNRSRFLRCYQCLKVFSSQKCLKIHLNESHEDAPEYIQLNYKCTLCTILYPNIEFAREHFENTHPEETLYKCTVPNCFVTSKFKRTIKNHIKKPHETEHSGESASTKPKTCELCGMLLKNVRTLVIHKKVIHNIVKERSQFSCRICGERYSSDEQRKLHYSIAHAGQLAFTCVECGNGFDSRAKLHAHRQIHKNNAKLVCSYCSKEFTLRASYKEHLLIHIGPRHQCPHCPKKFTQRSNLTRHVRIHTGVKPHKCSYCDKTFSDKGACSSHERVHTKEEHCSCSYCGKTFTKKQKLKYHMKFHTGIGLISCHICHKKFAYPYNLKEHLKTHDQSTILVCKCGKGFTTEKNLQQHMNSQHNTDDPKHVCPLCNHISLYRARHVEHVLGHGKRKHLRCSICHRGYSTRKAIRNHIKFKHNVAVSEQINSYFVHLTPTEIGLELPNEAEFLATFREYVNKAHLDLEEGNDYPNLDSKANNDVKPKIKQESSFTEEESLHSLKRAKRKPRKRIPYKDEESDEDFIIAQTEEIETRAKRKVKRPTRLGFI